MATEQLPARPIVDDNGIPTPWFQKFISDTLKVNTELGDLAGDADDLSEGLTQRFVQIAKQEIEYNADDTVSQVTFKDPETDTEVGVETRTYNPDGTVETITETTPERITEENYQYVSGKVVEIGVGITLP